MQAVVNGRCLHRMFSGHTLRLCKHHKQQMRTFIPGCIRLHSTRFHLAVKNIHKDAIMKCYIPGKQFSRQLTSKVLHSSGGTMLINGCFRMKTLHSFYPLGHRVSSLGNSVSFQNFYSSDAKIKTKVRGIQKDILPLTTKRIVRRKRTKDSAAREEEVFDVKAFAIAEELHIESLLRDLEKQGLYAAVNMPVDVHDHDDALHVEARYKVENEAREIFFFREGSVVFWNMPQVEANAVIEFLKTHQEGSYDDLLVQQEFEKVEFIYTEGGTTLVGDEIQLRRPEDTFDPNHQLEKYTFSNALALSVKLAIWEASLERYVDSIEWVLQDLKEGKKVRISRGEVLRKTGELFTLRHLINLSSDLLDTPDFYWDREELEMLYTKTCNHLNIGRRTKVMNEKLTYCCDLAELLISHLNERHSTRLEWMIIILILVEVIFEIVHVIERHS